MYYVRVYLNELPASIQKSWPELLRKMRVESDDRTGEKYLNLYKPFDPSSPKLPDIPQEHVSHVTMLDTFYSGFRAEGIYHIDGAEAVIKTETSRNERIGSILSQDFSGKAESLEKLREIYSQIRSNKLKPTEDWSVEIEKSKKSK